MSQQLLHLISVLNVLINRSNFYETQDTDRQIFFKLFL